MATARTFLNCSQSNGIAEVSSAKSPHVVSENVTMEYIQEISQYRESSARQSKQDEVSNNKSPDDAGIDSGDDLFITQKPVPEPVRPRRQRSCNLRSPRDGEEDESDSSSSSSNSKSYKKRSKIKRVTLPKYSFPFLPQRNRSKNPQFTRQLTNRQNITLHTFSMGGFFKCVRELWQDYDKGDDVPSSLPTMDMDGEYISPLSEEEERSESVDIKVVERKRFVAASKAKGTKGITQKSNRSVKGQRGKSNNDGRGMSLGRQRKTGQKTQAEESTLKDKVLFSDTESSDDGGPSRGAQAEKRTSHTSIQAQTEPPRTERRLTRANKRLAERQEREDELRHGSGATVSELLELQKSPRYGTLNGSEVSLNVTEPQAGVSHTDDLSQTGQAEEQSESQSLLLRSFPREITNDIMYSEMRGEEKNKSKRDHEHVEETCSQSREEPEGLPTARSVNMSEENPLATQISDEMEINDENGREKLVSLSDDDAVRHTPDTKQEKRKRKKKKRTADHLGQEEDGNVESDVRLEKDSLSLLTSIEANGGKKKKKEKRQYSEDDNSVEPQQSGTVLEPLNDDADTPRKKKKKKKKKKKRENLSEDEAVSCTTDQKEKVDDADNTLTITEGPDIEYAELVSKTKKKKKKKKSDKSCRNVTEDTVTQSDGSVSARKKKKRRTSSFLDADAEEKDAQTHGEQRIS
uniref:ABC transporter F family member 4-like isoform X2 n=1 Tax=Solea senegalensis TaxID=28829 RepID=UPI001CD8CEAF|nr:ABC transporter F family member 4-like isoform X2 [Solea senegalensis]